MSSTDDSRLTRFFERWIVPAAKRLRERGVHFFALAPEPDAESWYLGPPEAEPEFSEFEEQHCAAALRSRWERQELPELVELVDPLLDLAERLTPPPETADEAASLSPFVYVMY
jgi:hypothetical protein